MPFRGVDATDPVRYDRNGVRIYVDESGIFADPNNSKIAVSAVGALVMPERVACQVYRQFRALLWKWQSHGREIKGSQLDELQVSEIIGMLAQRRLFFACNAIDMALHSDSIVTEHKLAQADKIVERITTTTHPNLSRQLHEIRDRLSQISNPLYVQSQCLTNLVASVIQTALLWFLDVPKTLGRFTWRIDAKNASQTEYEDLWRTLVCPFLQSYSLRNPLVTVTEGDYTHFRKYENPPDMPHDHLEPLRLTPGQRFESVDLKKIMLEDIAFADSKSDLGLQLIDILVTTIRRALRSTLGPKGWAKIGTIMVTPLRSRDALQFTVFDRNISGSSLPYKHVFATIQQHANSILRK